MMKRLGFRARSNPVWYQPGHVRQIYRHERGVLLQCENGWVDLTLLAPDAVRVWWRLSDDHAPPRFTTFQPEQWLAVENEFADTEDNIELSTRSMLCRIARKPYRLRVELLPDHHTVCQDASGIGWRESGEIALSLSLHSDEQCFGLGARAARLNLRGRRYKLWNTDPGPLKRDVDPVPFSLPFYLGVHAHGSYGVLWDNPQRGQVDLTGSELVFEADGGDLHYTIMVGADATLVERRYNELLGRFDQPPLWALGYGHLVTAETLPQLLAPNQRVPTSVVYLTGDVQQQTIQQFHRSGVKVIASLSPAIPLNDGLPALRLTDDRLYSPNGVTIIPDFTDPVAQLGWSNRLATLIRVGIDGFALEGAEPTILNASGKPIPLPEDLLHANGQPHADQHNLFSGLMAQASVAAFGSEHRPLITTRSGGLNTPRSVFVRVGGGLPTWDNLKMSIGQIINLSLSGVMLAGVEVGGDPELYTRWLQAMLLVPQVCGSGSPWTFGQPYELINRLTLELRARLLPYLYSVIAYSRQYSTPVIRPLFMCDPGVRNVDDCYLVGDILVAPVVEKGAVTRSVTLPKGLWYDYWSNEPVRGGSTFAVTAPLERLPLFIRGGTILPMISPEPDTLHLHVFPGNGENVHYEDAGDGRDFELGNYRWIYMSCLWEGGDARFVITRRSAGRFEPPYKRIRIEVAGMQSEPSEVKLDRQRAPVWYYDGGVLEVNAEETVNRIEITRTLLPNEPTLQRRPR